MRVWCWTKSDVERWRESIQRLPLTNSYVSTKVSSISAKQSEKNGQNGMGEKGETSWMEEEEE
jgi:hypothetical protein